MGTVVPGDGRSTVLVMTAHVQLPKRLILTAALIYQEMNLLTHRRIEIIHRLGNQN